MVADLKRELASTLSVRRSSGDSGSSTTNWVPIVVGGTVLIVVAGAYFAGRGAAPKAVAVAAQDTPQQDMALQFLAQQQAASEKILAGQQELSSQIIESQEDLVKHSKRPIVICVASNKCPNPDDGGSQIVIQPGDSAPTQPVQPVQPPQVQTVSAPSGGYYDPWQAHYAEMQSQLPQMFSAQWNECIAGNWQLPADSRINCSALSAYLNREAR